MDGEGVAVHGWLEIQNDRAIREQRRHIDPHILAGMFKHEDDPLAVMDRQTSLGDGWTRTYWRIPMHDGSVRNVALDVMDGANLADMKPQYEPRCMHNLRLRELDALTSGTDLSESDSHEDEDEISDDPDAYMDDDEGHEAAGLVMHAEPEAKPAAPLDQVNKWLGQAQGFATVSWIRGRLDEEDERDGDHDADWDDAVDRNGAELHVCTRIGEVDNGLCETEWEVACENDEEGLYSVMCYLYITEHEADVLRMSVNSGPNLNSLHNRVRRTFGHPVEGG